MSEVTPDSLLREADEADAIADTVTALIEVIRDACSTIRDRLTTAGWGTDRIIDVSQQLADTCATTSMGPTELDALTEQLGLMDPAIDEARALGDQAAAQQAAGTVEAISGS